MRVLKIAERRSCRLRHRWKVVSRFEVAVFPLGKYLGAVGRHHLATVHRCRKCLLSRTIRVSTSTAWA